MTDYDLLCSQLRSLAESERHYLPLLANASALLAQSLNRLNWAGFYLMHNGRLLLGPFQGKTACIHIPVGKGVCGTAVAENRSLRVANVHDFAGHIACDSASNSELVIPIRSGGRVIGVLDLDSPEFDRFSAADQEGLEAFVRTLETVLDTTSLP